MQLVRGCWLVLIVFASCRVPPLSCPVEDEERKRQGRTRQKDGHSLTVPSCCLSYCTPRLKRNKGTGGDICSAFPVLIRINDINNTVHFSPRQLATWAITIFLSISTEGYYSVRQGIQAEHQKQNISLPRAAFGEIPRALLRIFHCKPRILLVSYCY